MDRITNSDKLVLLLRQKLEERNKASSTARRDGAKARQAISEDTGLHALAAMEGVEDQPLRRAFVENLLADQLGSALTNDAQFQQIVSRVTEAIDDDSRASELLSRLIADLRSRV
ncbi:MAG TPA: hypothetical protein VHL34_21475 [Rhizomicrobium sp.]|nr:hypothetical protein [Rhizomicrobium sp.]